MGMILFNIGLTYGFTALGDQTGMTLPAAFLKLPYDPRYAELSTDRGCSSGAGCGCLLTWAAGSCCSGSSVSGPAESADTVQTSSFSDPTIAG